MSFFFFLKSTHWNVEYISIFGYNILNGIRELRVKYHEKIKYANICNIKMLLAYCLLRRLQNKCLSHSVTCIIKEKNIRKCINVFQYFFYVLEYFWNLNTFPFLYLACNNIYIRPDTNLRIRLYGFAIIFIIIIILLTLVAIPYTGFVRCIHVGHRVNTTHGAVHRST